MNTGKGYIWKDPDNFLRGGPTENAIVLLYDTLISGFQWMLVVYKKSQFSSSNLKFFFFRFIY